MGTRTRPDLADPAHRRNGIDSPCWRSLLTKNGINHVEFVISLEMPGCDNKFILNVCNTNSLMLASLSGHLQPRHKNVQSLLDLPLHNCYAASIALTWISSHMLFLRTFSLSITSPI